MSSRRHGRLMDDAPRNSRLGCRPAAGGDRDRRRARAPHDACATAGRSDPAPRRLTGAAPAHRPGRARMRLLDSTAPGHAARPDVAMVLPAPALVSRGAAEARTEG